MTTQAAGVNILLAMTVGDTSEVPLNPDEIAAALLRYYLSPPTLPAYACAVVTSPARKNPILRIFRNHLSGRYGTV